MEVECDNKVIMISSDGQKFEISVKAAMRSQIMKESIMGNNQEEIEFNANNIEGDILKKIVEYLEHYENEEPKEIERPLPSLNFKECVDEWDYNFIDVDINTIFKIINASNYLNIPPLLELSSAKMASIIKGKTTEEVRQLFGIQNEFTPEEEQQIIEENKWCMENL